MSEAYTAPEVARAEAVDRAFQDVLDAIVQREGQLVQEVRAIGAAGSGITHWIMRVMVRMVMQRLEQEIMVPALGGGEAGAEVLRRVEAELRAKVDGVMIHNVAVPGDPRAASA